MARHPEVTEKQIIEAGVSIVGQNSESREGYYVFVPFGIST
jgi:hypothetical protein